MYKKERNTNSSPMMMIAFIITLGKKMMMMFAFITMNSGLVPLIEGLCAQILYFTFEIISGLLSHLLLLFFRRKNMLKKKAVSPTSHPASLHIHTHVYFVHIYEYVYAKI